MRHEQTILVPRLMDRVNPEPGGHGMDINAQNLNAKALLARFRRAECRWLATHYDPPDPAVQRSEHVRLVKLWHGVLGRLVDYACVWDERLFLFYQQHADAIFYPGPNWADEAGLQFRSHTGRRVPVIATLEGFGGDESREHQLTRWAGHPVYCQRISPEAFARVERMLRIADHIIAITPFVAEMGRRLYGDKVSMQPLGVDTAIFHDNAPRPLGRFRVVGAGTVKATKRPDVFLELAVRFPEADFVWFGAGPLREQLSARARERGLKNLRYPGRRSPEELAEEFRRSNLLALPSHAEGLPKVVQEAAACGLPAIVFGFYQTPTVLDGENGFVVWDDKQFADRAGELISDPTKASRMGSVGAAMAKAWDWDRLAPLWEDHILALARQR
jgi:glycosyltransferase involved in cell wall biosynthesis